VRDADAGPVPEAVANTGPLADTGPEAVANVGPAVPNTGPLAEAVAKTVGEANTVAGPVERLSAGGKRIRLGLTTAALAALLLGTVIGQDDAFPFGPFRMYSTTDDLNAPVASTRVEAVNSAGRRFALTDEMTGMRRAEIEGQLGRFRADPRLLAALATGYARRHGQAPRLVLIEVITRHFALRNGRPTGSWADQVDASWSARAGSR
jgi:hypothetical protein